MKRVQHAWILWDRLTRDTRLTRRYRQMFMSMNSLQASILLLTPLMVSAGCMMSMTPEIQVGQPDFNSIGIYLLCFFVIAIVLILLAAGVKIKAPGLGSYTPPNNRVGRIFLAVLGVLMLSFLAGLVGVASLSGLVALQRQDMPDRRSPKIEMSAPSADDRIITVSGAVSFEKYENAFKEHYSKLKIHATGTDAESTPIVATVDLDGRFAFDVPINMQASLTVTWNTDSLGHYVLSPTEINVPVWQASKRSDISFAFENVGDFFYRHKIEAIEAVRACKVEKADAGLTALLAVLERFGEGLEPQAQTWPHEVYHELADELAANHQSCTRNVWMFERKWRREAIERATNRDSRIRAMSAWADYSTRVYRPNLRPWPDLTLSDVSLVREEYRKFLEMDLQLITNKLREEAVRILVKTTTDPPAISGCLNNGQREALQSFESVLSEPVNLNRMMNVLSGLQRIVDEPWELGTWNYPVDGKGELQIVRRRNRDGGFEYSYKATLYKFNQAPPGRLMFAPVVAAPCRFETITDTARGRFVFTILEGPGNHRPLQMEPGNGTLYPRDGSAGSSAR